MIGVRASVTLGELRSIRVFVLGDVVRPGSYLVSGLSTMTNALYTSGGVKPIGSLRNIALMRGGNTIVDARSLRPAAARRYARRRAPDAGRRDLRAARSGRRSPSTVRCAGRRSTRSKASAAVSELVALAGGLNAERESDEREARARRAESRHDRAGRRSHVTGAQTAVRDGDVLRVPPNLDQLENSVRLAGNVLPARDSTSGRAACGSRDLLAGAGAREAEVGLELRARAARAGAEREGRCESRRICKQAWRQPNGRRERAACSRATRCTSSISRPAASTSSSRSSRRSKRRCRRTRPGRSCAVGGQVRAAGEYPLERGMRISDLLRAGGGLERGGVRHGRRAHALRDRERRVSRDGARDGQSGRACSKAIAAADLAAHAVRLPQHQRGVALARRGVDHAQAARWFSRARIRFGAARRCRPCCARAGGLTDLAFPEGSVFTRVELREREQRSSSRRSRAGSSETSPPSRSPSRTRARRSRRDSR